MIHLGIIEDNIQITESLVQFFRDETEIKIIRTAEYVEKFMNMEGSIPDVILLDLSLPYKNGMECIEELCEKYKGVNIIIHSVSADYDSIFKCLCSGAHSYLTKGESLVKIRDTIIATHAGGSQMSVEIARKVIDHFNKKNNKSKLREDERLNSKEVDVVNLIIEGKSYKMVADELGISLNTVRTYIKTIYKKLKINSNVELAKLYHKKDY
jgi:DNA-binding NarL/FixJ family response regulator